MATYVPNADDLTQPTEEKPVQSAAEEFRVLKAKAESNQTRIDTLEGSALQIVGGEYLADANINLGGNKIVNSGTATAPTDVPPLSQVQNIVSAAGSGIIASLREEQTAAAGQTLFTIVGFTYLPGASNLAVYVNGLRQDDGVAYMETSNSSVTFTEGLVAGDVVEFVSNESVDSDAVAVMRSELAAPGGAAIVGANDGQLGALFSQLQQAIDYLMSGVIRSSKYGLKETNTSAQNAIAFEALRSDAVAQKATVIIESGTYLLPPQTNIRADYTNWIFSPGAVLKLHNTQAADDFLVANSPIYQRFTGLTVDGNMVQQNKATFGADNAALVVVDAKDCDFYATRVASSPGKGFSLVSSNGGTTRNINISSFSGGDCATQVLIVDGNNMTGFFDRVTINGVKIGATGHAGVAINDGAHSITLSDVIADVQNSVWDAVSIRDSFDIEMTNVRGLRGRNGVYLQRLNGYCGRVRMNGVVGELSSQNGILIAGAEDVTGGVVVGRNNLGVGINITTGAGAYRSKNVNIAAPAGYDDQAIKTQQTGILAQGVDGLRIGKHTTYGNTVKQLSIVRALTSDVEVENRQTVRGSTGSIAPNTQAIVTLNWPAVFEDASIDIESVYVSVATSSLALSVTHVVAVTIAAVQVMVKNLSGTTAHTGELTVIGSRSK